MNFILKNKYLLYTFFTSFFIMTIAFALQGMYPFGDRQIMIIDSWHQYYPILQELHSKLQNGGSLLYSWNTGAGTNFLLMIGYYAMSPLNLISILVPVTLVREFMLFSTIFKIAFGASCFAFYLKQLFNRNDLSLLAFGLLYGFCGFMMGYYWDIMWLDCVALLPLVILGLHRVIEGKGFLLFTLTLALTLVSNFYIAYFVCEFIAIYFFILYFTRQVNSGFIHFIKSLARVAGTSLIGIGLSAFAIVPIIYGMGRAYGHASGNPTSIKTYQALIDIFNNLLSNVAPTVIDGLPNINSGMLALFLGLVYLTSTQVPLSKRIANGGLLLFLALSMNINVLNFIWHGFHFPNQVPYRFAFLFSFVLITMAYELFVLLDAIPFKKIAQVGGLLSLYLLLGEKVFGNGDTLDFTVFYASLAFVATYLLIFYWYKHDRITRGLFYLFLVLAVVAESGLAAYNATETAGNSGRNDYPAMNSAVQKALDYVSQSDPSFYRVEMYPHYSANDPLLYGYRGVGQFSSTSNSRLNTFAKKFGVSADPGSNSIRFLPATPVVNGLFSIKYILDKNTHMVLPNAQYEEVFSDTGVKVLKNKYPIPVAYRADESIRVVNTTNINPFNIQDEWLLYNTGLNKTVFSNVPSSKEDYTNMERVSLEKDLRYHYKNLDSANKGNASITFKAPTQGQYYAYMLNQSKTVTLKINGKTETYETPRGVLMDCGIVDKDAEFTLSFEVPAASTGFFDIAVVKFDEQAYAQHYEKMIDESLVVDSFSDTHIKGTIKVQDYGLLMTSIPYEPGWKAYIDGNKVDVIHYKDAFITLPISSGDHSVEFKYVPHGLMAGISISVLSALTLAAMAIVTKRLSKKAKGLPPSV